MAGEPSANGAKHLGGSAPPNAEAQLAGLIFALVLIDPDGHIASANQAAETLLGRSIGRLAGRHVGEVLRPLDPRVERRLREPDSAVVAREVAVRPGEAAIAVNLTLSPLGDHPGWRVLTLSPIAHGDIDMGEQSASLGAPSILAHEIKNPLAAIRGAGQLAARKLPESERALGETIVAEADRIARLIDRMQQLGSEMREPPAPCNPHVAIRNAAAMLRRGGADGPVIREEFDPSLPPAMVNRDALEQVLVNLMSNAIEAVGDSPDGEVCVRTRFASGRVFSAIRFGRAVRVPIEITITDNGPGIAPDLRERVFEPFVTSRPSGQGLGLALVRKLVRDMNGSIGHERDEERGLTHFRLHLPRAKGEEDA